MSVAGDVDGSEAVDRDSPRGVVVAASYIGRIHERPVRGELGDKHLREGARGPLVRVARGEVRRVGAPGDVDVALGVGGDGAGEVVRAASQVSREANHGVDEEWTRAIVRADHETEFVRSNGPEGPGNGLAVLEQAWWLKLERGAGTVRATSARACSAVAKITDRGISCKFATYSPRGDRGADADAAGVGAGRDQEVELQPIAAAVEDQVDAGIQVAVADPRVSPDPGAPRLGIAPSEPIHAGGQRIHALQARIGARAGPLQASVPQHRPAGFQTDHPVPGARHKTILMRLKRQRAAKQEPGRESCQPPHNRFDATKGSYVTSRRSVTRMNISVKGEYALKAILDLASQSNDRPVKIAEIAARQKIPQKFLELILAQLKQGGFVHSRRGAEGGYLLARGAEAIMVGEVLRFIEGPLSPVDRSHRGKKTAPDSPFTEMWKRVDQAVSEVIDRTSFAELIERWTQKQSHFVANWEI